MNDKYLLPTFSSLLKTTKLSRKKVFVSIVSIVLLIYIKQTVNDSLNFQAYQKQLEKQVNENDKQ